METTAVPRRPRTTSRGRASDRTSVDEGIGLGPRDEQYDLLTAALIGVAIGVGTTLLVRRGPSGRRPLSPVLAGAARSARWAGVGAARLGMRGAHKAREGAEDLWERVPREEIADNVREYLGRARETIDDAVASELRDLRKALRRQRRRLGI